MEKRGEMDHKYFCMADAECRMTMRMFPFKNRDVTTFGLSYMQSNSQISVSVLYGSRWVNGVRYRGDPLRIDELCDSSTTISKTSVRFCNTPVPYRA